MNLTIGANKVAVEKGNYLKDLSVELEDIDGESVLEDLRNSGVSSDQAVKVFGPAPLLAAIGEDAAKEYFDLVEKP